MGGGWFLRALIDDIVFVDFIVVDEDRIGRLNDRTC